MLWESCELGAFQACHYALLPRVAIPDHWIANYYTARLFFQLSPGLFRLSSEQKDTRSPSGKENLLVELHLPIAQLNVFLHKSGIPQVPSSPSELWQTGLCQPNSHLLSRNASPGPSFLTTYKFCNYKNKAKCYFSIKEIVRQPLRLETFPKGLRQQPVWEQKSEPPDSI